MKKLLVQTALKLEELKDTLEDKLQHLDDKAWARESGERTELEELKYETYEETRDLIEELLENLINQYDVEI